MHRNMQRSGRATTVLTYDHASAEAYLDRARGHERVFDGMLLCESHARRFTAPRGWDTIDRRDDTPGLVTDEVGA